MDLREHFRIRDKVGQTLSDDMKNIANLTIDGNVISGYGSYSFVRVKEYVKEPTRSQDGQISNLDSYTTFITPKVRIKFNALSIDGYRVLMNLILAKNEFYVGCYDFVADRWVHQNMYFYPNDYPEIFQYDLDVLAVLNYEIELIGTNTNNQNVTVTLNSNSPEANVASITYTMSNVYQGEPIGIPYPETFPSRNNDSIAVFDGREYKFGGWNTKSDGTGVNYFENDEVEFSANTTLYAVWQSGKVNVNFNWSVNGDERVYVLYKSKNEKFVANEPDVWSVVVESGERAKYEVREWFTASSGGESIIGKYPTDLTQDANLAYNAYGTPTRTVLTT